MDDNSTAAITFKLFAGFFVNSELKMNLASSKSWKNVQTIPTHSPADLIEIRYEKSQYIGQFLETEKIPLSRLRECEVEVGKKLQEYCPQIDVALFKFCVFPQFFVH